MVIFQGYVSLTEGAIHGFYGFGKISVYPFSSLNPSSDGFLSLDVARS